MKKISILIFGFIFFVLGANLVFAQEGAFNNVLVKDFKAEYIIDKNSIEGEVIIGNFGEQSFYNLNYVLQISAYQKETSLGEIVYEEYNQDSFSIQAGSEKNIKLSYQLPDFLPTGTYNFVFQIIDSRGRPLGFENYEFNYSNDSENLFLDVDIDTVKIEINQEEHPWGIGAPSKINDEVNLKFEVENKNNISLTGILPKIEVYAYTTNLNKVKELEFEKFSIGAGEKKLLSYSMPNLEKPQSYLAIINLNKDGQAVSLPIRGRWVVEGIQGKIFTSGLNKENLINFELVGSPYSQDQDGSLSVVVSDQNKQVCFSESRKLYKVGELVQNVSVPIIFEKECLSPTLKATFKISNKVVDVYEVELDDMSADQLNKAILGDSRAKKDSKLGYTWIFLSVLVLGLIILIIILFKKNKLPKTNLLLLGAIFLAGGLMLLPANSYAFRADAGSYPSWNNSWNNNFVEQNILNNHKNCLAYRNSYCYVSRLTGDAHGAWGHSFIFDRIGWAQPTPNKAYNQGEQVSIKVSNVHSWCSDYAHYSNTINYRVFSRASGELVKQGSVRLNKNTRQHAWNIGVYDSGEYVLYLSVYSSWAQDFLFQGMIRYFRVIASAPSVSLSANPSSVDYNSASNLIWSSTNADSCTASGAWSGSKSLSGNQSTGNLTSDQTYKLTCTGPGGEDTDDATINVGSAPICTGSIPANASRYDAEEENGLTNNTAWSYSASDTSAKCQYRCSDSYIWNGSSCIAPTLSVSLSANPDSGNAPLNDVDLTASAGGTETGTINYTFYCNRSDTGTNITPGYTVKYDGVSTNPKTAVDVCDYSSAGTYTAKVIIERGSLAKEARQTITVTNNPPDKPSNLQTNAASINYCSQSPNNIFLSWQFNDPDSGDTQSAYEIQVIKKSNGQIKSTGKQTSGISSISSANLNNLIGSQFVWYDSSNQGYFWKIRVWDSNNEVSPWSDSNSFKTVKHQYPSINFSWSPLSPSQGEATQFTDQSTVYGGASKASWSWAFTNGDPATSGSQNPTNIEFTSEGNKNISLEVADSDGYTCPLTKIILIEKPLPGWEEF